MHACKNSCVRRKCARVRKGERKGYYMVTHRNNSIDQPPADASPFGSTGKPKPATVQDKNKAKQVLQATGFSGIQSRGAHVGFVDFQMKRRMRCFCGFPAFAFPLQTLGLQMHGRSDQIWKQVNVCCSAADLTFRGTVAGVILRQSESPTK